MIRFVLNAPEELHQKLKEEAARQGQTLNGLVRQILWDWDKTDEKKREVKP